MARALTLIGADVKCELEKETGGGAIAGLETRCGVAEDVRVGHCGVCAFGLSRGGRLSYADAAQGMMVPVSGPIALCERSHSSLQRT